MSGSTGCNRYTASITATDTSLRVGVIANEQGRTRLRLTRG